MAIQPLVPRAEATVHQAVEEVLAVIHLVLVVLHHSSTVLHLKEVASVDNLHRSSMAPHQLHLSSTVLLQAEVDSEDAHRLHPNNTVRQVTVAEMVTVPTDTVPLGMAL